MKCERSDRFHLRVKSENPLHEYSISKNCSASFKHGGILNTSCMRDSLSSLGPKRFGLFNLRSGITVSGQLLEACTLGAVDIHDIDGGQISSVKMKD